MALSISDCQRGARVCHMHDLKGKPLAVTRMGTISKTVSINGDENDGNAIKEIWVKFDQPADSAPVKVAAAELVLHKAFDQARYDEMVDRERNAVVLGPREKKP